MRSVSSVPGGQHRAATAETPLLLSVPQTARLLGIGVTFAWELVHAGMIPSVKLGRRVLIPRRTLEQVVGGHQFVENAREPVEQET